MARPDTSDSPWSPDEEKGERLRLSSSLIDSAARLSGQSAAPAALLLLREALLILRHEVLSGQEAPGSSAGASEVELLRRGIDSDAGARAPARIELLEMNGDPSPVQTWLRLSSRDLLETKISAETTARWLLKGATRPTEEELRRVQRVRRGRAAAAVAIVIGMGLYRLLSPTNLALGKPVTTSGSYEKSVAPRDGSGFVNGIVESAYGVHTQVNALAWVQVDLLREYHVAKVVVFNRGEARYQGEGLPLILELSLDGRTFEPVARAELVFSQTKPWTVNLTNRRGRFVRIRNERRAYVALSELQVFGDAATPQ